MAIEKEEYQKIYNRLNQVEVLDQDCGSLCGHACCHFDNDYLPEIVNPDFSNDNPDDEMVILLFPGEEELQKENGWLEVFSEDGQALNYPPQWQEVYFARCKGNKHCRRASRPIQCRTFPLWPHLADDQLYLIYYPEQLPYMCPLIERRLRLRDDFLQETYAAWQELLEDEAIRELVLEDSLDRDYRQLHYQIVYSE